MSDIFTRMAAVSERMLRPAAEGGFGSGTIVLVRLTPGDAPTNPWDPPSEPTSTRLTLNANAFGVAKELIGKEVAPGNAIVASDKRVLSAPIEGGYDPADILEIDGRPVTVLSVRNIVGSGTVSAVEFIVRGGGEAYTGDDF